MLDSEIPFTQYILPDGRREKTAFKTDDKNLLKKAQEILDAGFVFECEILRTGHVSLTITDSDIGDMSCKISSNGPAVLGAMEDMIMNFDIKQKKNEVDRIRSSEVLGG